MTKLIKVINNKDRYFNGARKGGILEVSKDRLEYYLQNGFSEVKNIETKENIVKTTNEKVLTKKELKEILDHNGVEYAKNANIATLNKLVKNIKTKENIETENNGDIETLKAKLIEEAIVSEEDLEGKSDSDITQIATDNGLI